MKRIAVLGSTGSIGVQTLDVAAQHPDELRVVALAAHRNGEALLSQATQHGVSALALYDEAAAQAAGVPGGMDALLDIVRSEDVDVVVVSVAGVIGLLPTLSAIEAGKNIALASKEVLVAAGEIVMPLVEKHGVQLTPIDSEHSAVFQCLQGSRGEEVECLFLTASGGPFRGRKASDLAHVTVDDALAHPTWRMGGKITIDSATLMNKGLETIEARWLFGLEMEQVHVVVHPQSIVHSLVRFRDGSVLGQMGWPDMRLPIQYALMVPDRAPNALRRWDPCDTPELTFEPVDEETFPSIRLARESMRVGGTMPCAMNAANEEAANAFLRGECGFLSIAEAVEETMTRHTPQSVTLEALLETDRDARDVAKTRLARRR